MLYTSGSTGKPKGIVHTQAGYLLYANMTMKVSQSTLMCLNIGTPKTINFPFETSLGQMEN